MPLNGTPGGITDVEIKDLDNLFDVVITTPVNGQVLVYQNGIWINSASGGTEVVGPASSTDNAIARFNGTTGKIIQNSTVIIDDNGYATGFTGIDSIIDSNTDSHPAAHFYDSNTGINVNIADAANSGYDFYNEGTTYTAGNLTVGSSSTLLGSIYNDSGGAVFNGGLGSNDFQVNTNGTFNTLIVKGSTGLVGIGVVPSYGLDVVMPTSGTPYYINAAFRAPGANQDVSILLESQRLSTTQRWFFGSGSGGGPNTNNFRLYDLNNSVEAINVAPSGDIYLNGSTSSNTVHYLGSLGGVVHNEQGAAVDFRVESDLKQNMIFVSGATNQVGINALAAEISAGGGSVLTAKSDANGGFTNVFGVIAPNTTAGNRVCFNVGVTNALNDINTFAFYYDGHNSTLNAFEIFFAFQSTPVARFLANGNGGIGLGSGAPSARWHAISTTEQMRLGYDTSNYYSTAVGSTGGVTFDAVGSGAGFDFSDRLTVNTNPVIVVLSSTGGINAKTVAATTLYTVPAGRTAIITAATVRCTAASAITIGPALGIGVAAGEQDIFASTAITALTTTAVIFGFAAVGMSVSAAAASVIKVGIDTGSTGTSQTIAIDLMGYLL